MSLKDLLPPGTFDEIESEVKHHKETARFDGNTLKVKCPICGKEIIYSKDNPFRPFCSERCKLIDLGAWANEERTVAGRTVNEDEDADLLNDPNLPKRFDKEDKQLF